VGKERDDAVIGDADSPVPTDDASGPPGLRSTAAGTHAFELLEPRRWAVEQGHGPCTAVHRPAPWHEVMPTRQRGRMGAGDVVVIIATGVEIRERGQGGAAGLDGVMANEVEQVLSMSLSMAWHA
jgi:hypothetical protein